MFGEVCTRWRLKSPGVANLTLFRRRHRFQSTWTQLDPLTLAQPSERAPAGASIKHIYYAYRSYW